MEEHSSNNGDSFSLDFDNEDENLPLSE